MADPSFDYASTGTEALGDYTNAFTNSESTDCPITSCSMKAQNCISAYVPGQLAMGASTPWALTANKNVFGGYTETVCLECTNGA